MRWRNRMRILVLQLKRIGDLILTTPALFALREKFPAAHVTLAIEEGSRELLPAIDFIDETLIFRRKAGNAHVWLKLLFSGFDICLDFTGSDRSAFFSLLSRASRRVSFSRLQKSGP